jgi:hypothetical protein
MGFLHAELIHAGTLYLPELIERHLLQPCVPEWVEDPALLGNGIGNDLSARVLVNDFYVWVPLMQDRGVEIKVT